MPGQTSFMRDFFQLMDRALNCAGPSGIVVGDRHWYYPSDYIVRHHQFLALLNIRDPFHMITTVEQMPYLSKLYVVHDFPDREAVINAYRAATRGFVEVVDVSYVSYPFRGPDDETSLDFAERGSIEDYLESANDETQSNYSTEESSDSDEASSCSEY